jgi:hypothetical protein
MEWHGYSWQPDPSRRFVHPQGGKLVRRGAAAFSIVWKMPEGKDAKSPLGSTRDCLGYTLRRLFGEGPA